MNENIKSEWIAALRSGKFQQAKSVLRNKNDGFCCLGVLCEILRPDQWVRSDNSWYHDDGESMPSDDILAEAGLSNSTHVDTLTNWNDNGKSFLEIADYIEREL